MLGLSVKLYRKIWRTRLSIVILLLNIIVCKGYAQPVGSEQANVDSADVVRTWQLPDALKNVAALVYISDGKMACMSEDVGSIFIYNLESGTIENEYQFGQAGDYEGLEIIGKNAYVGCADGRIVEIINYASDTPVVKEYGTHLTVRDHVNGLCYDRKNRRLLVSVRGLEDDLQPYKNVYGFRLQDKRMLVKPVVRIDLRNHWFNSAQAKRLQTVFQPTDLDINPVNGQLYVIDGSKCQLLRMRLTDGIRDVIMLDKNKFFQPEGITITPSGEIFIASRGARDQPGTLLQVRIIHK